MQTKLVLKTESLEFIVNGTFIFCNELQIGFIKRDLSLLGLTDYSFNTVKDKIETLDLDELNSKRLDTVWFENGEEKISHKMNRFIEEVILTLPSNTTAQDITNIMTVQRGKSDYFSQTLVDSAVLLKTFIDDDIISYIGNTMSLFSNLNNVTINNFVLEAQNENASAIGNLIIQDEGETDYSGVADISIKSIHNNISASESSSDTLVSYTPLIEGNSIDIVIDGFLNEMIIGTVTTDTIENIGKIDSVTFINSYLFGTSTSNEQLFTMKPDGTRIYTCGRPEVVQFNLSTPWDLSTISDSGRKMNISALAGNPYSATLSDDGRNFYFGDYDGNIVQYKLSTAWDIGSGSYYNKVNVSGHLNKAQGVFFKDGNTAFFNDTNWIHEYHLSTSWNITTATYVKTSNIAPVYYGGVKIINDGKLMFGSEIVGDPSISCYTLDTPWDISTLTLQSTTPLQAYGLNFLDIFVDESSNKLMIMDKNTGIFEFDYILGSINTTQTFSVDTASITNGLTPEKVILNDNKISFDFGNGYLNSENKVDSVITETDNDITILSVFDDVLYPSGSRNIRTKLDISNHVGITEVSAVITKLQ